MASPVAMEDIRKRLERSRGKTLWIVGGRISFDARTAVRANIAIRNGLILGIADRSGPGANYSSAETEALDLSGHLILPGLINAHDHLEFNLFPRLGNGPYPNYEEWAEAIYKPDQSPLAEHVAVPEGVRLWWGGLKNLLAGVTTVCHHNPYVASIFDSDFPVRVVKRFAWSHSLAFGKEIPSAFSSVDSHVPFIIHLCEGTDEKSAEEIFVLRGLGALDRRTVIVHGVGLGAAGHELVEGSGAAIIWCPTSNIFTLGQTLDAQTIMACRRMALGSDSALTAQGDLLDEIAFANHRHGITPERIYSLVTDGAADVLRLRSGEGMLRPGARADLIAFKDTGGSPADALVHAGISRVELVILGGQPTLFSPEMTKRWPDEFRASMESTRVGGVERFVRAPVRWLMEETRKHLGDRFCLAGKEICS